MGFGTLRLVIRDDPKPDASGDKMPMSVVATRDATTLPDAHGPTVDMPRAIGRFAIERLLGEGGMGRVYLARDRAEHHGAAPVALKTLRSADPVALMRFKSEFRYTASIAHPNLVKLYELGVDADTFFLTMERVEGRDLGQELAMRSPPSKLDAAVISDLFAQLLDGLFALHAAGVRHLDLKPNNAMVTDDGRVVLLDFGLAALRGGKTRGAGENRIVGTPAYMSPEQARGAPTDARADLYALGVMLYEALVGARPFSEAGGTLSLMLSKTSADAPHPNRDGAFDHDERLAALAQLARDLLERAPEARPTAEDVMRVLRPGTTLSGAAPRARTVPLIGRDEELAAIVGASAERAPGSPMVVRVSGLSGVGKSRLVREASIRLKERATVLYARCHEFEAIPYKGLDDLVDQAVLQLRERRGDHLIKLCNQPVAHAARMFPAIFGAIPHLPEPVLPPGAGDAREVAYAGVAQLLALLAADHPLCLILDDAQWGDAAAGRVLASLLSPPDPLPILFVLAYRSDEAKDSPLLRQLEPLSGRGFYEERHVELEPLDKDAALALAKQFTHGGVIQTGELEGLAEEAAGNPFFIEQLALHSAQGDRRVSVDSVVQARVEELSDQAKRLLTMACVAGQPLAQRSLVSAAGITDARASVSVLSAKSLLRVDGTGADARVVAYHDRIREGVLASLERGERQRCHADLARQLLDEPNQEPHLVARHLNAAGQRSEAARYAVLAADESMRTLAFQAAADSYRDALAWSDGAVDEAPRLRRARGDALHRAGRCDEAGEAYLEAAEGMPMGRSRMEVERLAAETLLSAGAVKQAFEVLRPLFATARVPFPSNAAAALRGMVKETARVRIRVRGKAPVARDPVDEEALFKSELCWSVGKGLSNIAPVEGSVTILRSLLYGLDSGVPRAAANGMLFVGSGFMPFMGSRPDDFMARARRVADAEESPTLRGLLHVAWCQRGLLEGTWDAAVEHGDRAITLLLESNEPTAWSVAVARTTITALLEYRGRLGEMRSRSEEFLRVTQNSGEQITFVMVTSALGYTLAAADDREGLRRAIDEMRDTMASWTVDFGMWDFYRLRLEVLECFLGEHPASALEQVDQAWSGIVRANLLRVPVVLPAILHVRLAAEVAALCEKPGNSILRKRIRKTIGRLQKVGRADGPIMASIGAAALAEDTGDRAGADARLEEARAAAAAARCGAIERTCAWVLAGRGGDLGAREEAAALLRADGVMAPGRWALYAVPGFGLGQGNDR